MQQDESKAGSVLRRVPIVMQVMVGGVGRLAIVSRLPISGQKRGRVSVCSLCRSYGGSTGAPCRGLGLVGGWRNIGCSLDSVGGRSGQRNIGVARLHKCRVRKAWFLYTKGLVFGGILVVCWTP